MGETVHRNSLKPGHKLHSYRIEKVLGQGGFGITYLAYNSNLDRLAAIKEYLPIELAVREGDFSVHPLTSEHGKQFHWGLDRFLKEARTLAKFEHPNIVRVLDVFEDNHTAYMVMSYEEGESMQDELTRRKTMEEAELLNILIPILGGLEKVHEMGFLHRDIKPANIFLRKDGSPVLLDFGSARQALGVHTKTLTTMVSPGYAPFEQYYSKSDAQGPWTDIYSLGATMYRGLAGIPPMDAVDRSRVILKGGHDTFVPALEIGRGVYSERFLRAIDHALQFREENRPQTIPEWKREFASPTQPVLAPKQKPVLTPDNQPTENIQDVVQEHPCKQETARPSQNNSGQSRQPVSLFGILMAATLLFIAVIGLAWIYRDELVMQTAQFRQRQAEITTAKTEAERAQQTEAKADLEALRLKIELQEAEQEAKRKAEEERLRAVHEAKQKLEAEFRRKIEEEHRLAAEEEAKKQAEESARLKAEEEAKKAESAKQLSALAGEFVDIHGGRFQMGCSPGESECNDNEKPVHGVTVKPFRMGKYEVTVGQFRRFVEDSVYRTDAENNAGGNSGCWSESSPGKFGWVAGRSWRDPGFTQTDNHPVVCVSWNDAQAYIDWLNGKADQRFQLATEAEWEYAARAGTATSRFWGNSPNACQYANVFDQAGKSAHPNFDWEYFSCNDGHGNTAPVGNYQPNAFGLYDMLGNIWEWTEDCWNESYNGAPSDGSAWTTGDCSRHVQRGGSWYNGPRFMRSADRFRYRTSNRHLYRGFRLVQSEVGVMSSGSE